ncbi:hypothetical protein NKDENANG_00853 [Candidatus Entotheonellaceae bacterium PAL068K]
MQIVAQQDQQGRFTAGDELSRHVEGKSPLYMEALKHSQASSLTSGRSGFNSSEQLSNRSKNACWLLCRSIV